jgi:hypothetical protein
LASVRDIAHATDRDRLARRVSAASYGTVLVLAALASIGLDDVQAGAAWALVIGAGAATWLAHVYAEVVGDHVRSSAGVSRHEIGRAVADGCPIVLATVPPAVVLGLGRLGFLHAIAAVWAAAVIAALQLVGVGIYAGGTGSRRRGSRWVYASETALVGVAIVTVKLFIAH